MTFQASASFSPDGNRILTAGSDKARIWDASTGQELITFEGKSRYPSAASFSPDGARVLTKESGNIIVKMPSKEFKKKTELSG
jgi:WD40 repeat protein